MCTPPPKKSIYFNEPIFIKVTVAQQIVANMFCTGLYWNRRNNLENTSKCFIFSINALNYNMGSTAPILINLILTERRYVKIFCTQFTQIHQQIWKVQVEIYWLHSVKYSWHWVAFHETLDCFITFLQDSRTEFHENRTNGLVSDTEWQTDGLKEGSGLHILFRWGFTIVLLNSNIGI